MPINTGFKNYYKFRTTRNNVTLAKCVELVYLIFVLHLYFIENLWRIKFFGLFLPRIEFKFIHKHLLIRNDIAFTFGRFEIAHRFFLSKFSLTDIGNTVWHEVFAGVYFCGLAFFVFCEN